MFNRTVITANLRKEVMNAYADCHMDDFNIAMSKRDLNFQASASCSAAEAYDILTEAIPHGYNAFSARLLKKLHPDTQVIIAREMSPCLYVEYDPERPMPSRINMRADEWEWVEQPHPLGRAVRFWWD